MAKTKRRKLTTRDEYTQTDVQKEWLQAQVILDKMSESKVRRITHRNSPRGSLEASDQLVIQNPSMLSLPKKTSSISKPPGSYRIFAKPITNNERANSTLVSDTGDELPQAAMEQCNQNKKVRFVKPGPLSYKQRVMRQRCEDMNVPIMLSEQTESNVERRNSLNLETILEQINENSTATPDLELNFDMNCFNLEPQDIGVQTGISVNTILVNPEAEEGFIGDRSKSGDVENPTQEKAQPKTIQMTFKGVTTTITSRSTSQNSKAESSSSEDDEDVGSFPKYVKIKAHTVHIHNHFYSSQ